MLQLVYSLKLTKEITLKLQATMCGSSFLLPKSRVLAGRRPPRPRTHAGRSGVLPFVMQHWFYCGWFALATRWRYNYNSKLERALGRAHTFAYHRIGHWIMNMLALVACQLDENWPCYGKKKIVTFSPWPWPLTRSIPKYNQIVPDNNQSSHQISCDSV